MPSEQHPAPQAQRYHVLVRRPEQNGAVTLELTRDEFLKLQADLSANGSPLECEPDGDTRVDIRLVQHRPGCSGRAERVNPADLRRCLDNNSYLRTDIAAALRNAARLP